MECGERQTPAEDHCPNTPNSSKANGTAKALTNGAKDVLTNGAQELVNLHSNSDTYVVKKPEVRKTIPAFDRDETTHTSHTYRVRKPNRFVHVRESNSEPPVQHASNDISHVVVHHRIESSRQTQQKSHNTYTNASNNSQNVYKNVCHNSQNVYQDTQNVCDSSQILPGPLNGPPVTDNVRNSIEYFDSIETSTSASGSVFYSAPGSSMNSNRPHREAMAECDSLDQSQPDISDSEDLVWSAKRCFYFWG